MSNVTSWLRKHCLAVRQLLDKKNPKCKLKNVFWVTLLLVDDIGQQAAITFKSLQSMNLILHQQQGSIQNLKSFLMEQFRVLILVNKDLPDLSSDGESNTGTNENLQLSLNEIYGMLCKNVRDYVEDMGSFALNLLQNMEENDIQRLLQSVT